MNNETSIPYLYWAFISYSHNDLDWALWLRNAIETYSIPKQLDQQEIKIGESLPKRLNPLFRDRDELYASTNFGKQLKEALRVSKYLIVICSPSAAQSEWVNNEIKIFKDLGRESHIIPIIIDGEPGADEGRECFPSTLKELVPIAADARKGRDGKTDAKLRVIAGMLGVSFDVLKQRDTNRRIRNLQITVTAALILVTLFAVLTWFAYQQRNKAEIERDQKQLALDQLKHENYNNVIALASSKLKTSLPDVAENLLWGLPAELRSWEWGRLMFVARQELLSLQTGESEVKSVTFSPNGRFLLTYSLDDTNSGTVFDLSVPKQIFTIKNRALFSNYGSLLLTYYNQDYANILNLPSGDTLLKITDLVGDENTVAFSPDGRHVASIHTNSIKIWDLKTLLETISWSQPMKSFNGLAYSPLGNYLVVIDGRIALIFNCTEHRDPLRFKLPIPQLSALAFAPDDSHLLIAGPSHTATIYNMLNGNKEMVLEGHTSDVIATAWSPDGKLVATGANDQTTRIWDVSSGSQKQLFKGDVAGIAFSSDSRLIGAIGSIPHYNPHIFPKHFRIWQLDAIGKEIEMKDVPMWGWEPPFSAYWQTPDHYSSLAFSPDGSRFWWKRKYDDYSTPIRSTYTGQATQELKGNVTCVSFSPNNQLVAAGMRNGSVRLWEPYNSKDPIDILSTKGEIIRAFFTYNSKRLFTIAKHIYRGSILTGQLWDTDDTREPLAEIPLLGWGRSLMPVSFSDDNTNLVALTSPGLAHVLDIKTGNIISVLKPKDHNVSSVAISSDGNQIVTGNDNGSITIWNAKTAQQLITFEGHSTHVWNVSFSPDCRCVVSECLDMVLVHDIKNSRLIIKTTPVDLPPSSQSESFIIDWTGRSTWSVAFSGNGKRLVALGKNHNAAIYDSQNGKAIFTLDGHSNAIRSVAFSKNGRFVATSSDDNTTRIWNVKTGKQTSQLNSPSELIRFADFLTNENFLVVQSDSEIFVYDIQNQKTLTKIRDISRCLAFSIDGKRVIMSSDKGVAICCDIESGSEILSLTGHYGKVISAAFSIDGMQMATGDSEGNAKIWKAIDWRLSRKAFENLKQDEFSRWLHRNRY